MKIHSHSAGDELLPPEHLYLVRVMLVHKANSTSGRVITRSPASRAHPVLAVQVPLGVGLRPRDSDPRGCWIGMVTCHLVPGFAGSGRAPDSPPTRVRGSVSVCYDRAAAS